MRDDEAGLVDRRITKQDDVEVEAARRVGIGARATPLLLDGEQRLEKIPRRHACFPHGRGVQEQRLWARGAHGNRVVEPRHPKIAEKFVEPGDGVIEMGGAVTQIRSESNRGNDQIPQSITRLPDYPITRFPYLLLDPP